MDYNPLKGGLALISSLMFRKSRSLEDIICQYIDGFLISTISVSKQAVKANRYRCENS
jgi:intein-encoded DNA endonuclease-like protein